MELDPETCKWKFLGNDGDMKNETDPEEDKNEFLCLLVDDWLKKETWSGTATDLSNALNAIDSTLGITPLNVRKKLETNATLLKEEFNIILDSNRNGNKRLIFFERHTEQQSLNDSMTV